MENEIPKLLNFNDMPINSLEQTNKNFGLVAKNLERMQNEKDNFVDYVHNTSESNLDENRYVKTLMPNKKYTYIKIGVEMFEWIYKYQFDENVFQSWNIMYRRNILPYKINGFSLFFYVGHDGIHTRNVAISHIDGEFSYTENSLLYYVSGYNSSKPSGLLTIEINSDKMVKYLESDSSNSYSTANISLKDDVVFRYNEIKKRFPNSGEKTLQNTIDYLKVFGREKLIIGDDNFVGYISTFTFPYATYSYYGASQEIYHYFKILE